MGSEPAGSFERVAAPRPRPASRPARADSGRHGLPRRPVPPHRQQFEGRTKEGIATLIKNFNDEIEDDAFAYEDANYVP